MNENQAGACCTEQSEGNLKNGLVRAAKQHGAIFAGCTGAVAWVYGQVRKKDVSESSLAEGEPAKTLSGLGEISTQRGMSCRQPS
jgi:hypothetical protein